MTAPMDPAAVPKNLIDLFCEAWYAANPTWSRPVTEARVHAAPAILAAVLPAHEAMIRAKVIKAERAAIIAGIKHYFAPSDDPLYEDVRILCDRIERGEYGTGSVAG